MQVINPHKYIVGSWHTLGRRPRIFVHFGVLIVLVFTAFSLLLAVPICANSPIFIIGFLLFCTWLRRFARQLVCVTTIMVGGGLGDGVSGGCDEGGGEITPLRLRSSLFPCKLKKLWTFFASFARKTVLNNVSGPSLAGRKSLREHGALWASTCQCHFKTKLPYNIIQACQNMSREWCTSGSFWTKSWTGKCLRLHELRPLLKHKTPRRSVKHGSRDLPNI